MVLNRSCAGIVLLLLLGLAIHGQAPVKYWVSFKDKTGSKFSVSKPEEFLGERSVWRRKTYGIPVHESDLPVNSSYLVEVAKVPDVTVLLASKWLNGVVISCPDVTIASQALSTINSFSFVAASSRVRKVMVSSDPLMLPFMQPALGKSGEVNATAHRGHYGYAYWQTKQLNLECLHDKGFMGEGMVIGVMDAGFLQVDVNPFFEALRARGGILGTRDFVTGGTSVYEDSEHGAQVLSCMAADLPDKMLGTAPRAAYWLFRTEEGASETISEEYFWIRAAEFADSVGCDVITTSLGYTDFNLPEQNHTLASLDGRTAPMSIASTMAARKGIFVLTAAGNEGATPGWNRISVAADADSVCAVGAIDSLSQVPEFSGKGPTADGRIKPDLVALGAGAALGGLGGISFKGNGTSFSTPILAGAVACYWQANRGSSNMDIFAALKKNASHATSPGNDRGWGTPNLCKGVYEKDLDFNAWFGGADKEYLYVTIQRSTYDEVKIQVVDLHGKIHLESIADGAMRFNAAHLPYGIYVVRLTNSKSKVAKKVGRL